MTSIADAGVASLADLADSVAGGVTDLAVPVRVKTYEVALLQECVIQQYSVFSDSVYRDGEVDCYGCVSPNAWFQGMRDFSVCDIGCDPDCVDRTVPEGSDDYPVGMLPSEPLCVITDDMTYQEKIEAQSGTIYDYDDVSDNRPDYFDYDDRHDYEELYGFSGLVEDGIYYDSY